MAGRKAARKIALALQGGGSHGAFTWAYLIGSWRTTRLKIRIRTNAPAPEP